MAERGLACQAAGCQLDSLAASLATREAVAQLPYEDVHSSALHAGAWLVPRLLSLGQEHASRRSSGQAACRSAGELAVALPVKRMLCCQLRHASAPVRSLTRKSSETTGSTLQAPPSSAGALARWAVWRARGC